MIPFLLYNKFAGGSEAAAAPAAAAPVAYQPVAAPPPTQQAGTNWVAIALGAVVVLGGFYMLSNSNKR